MVVNGTVNGKKGSFALRATGTYDGAVTTTWTVVEGSGTGELKSIKGKGGYFLPTGRNGGEATLEVEV
jgi:hypothetical protein